MANLEQDITKTGYNQHDLVTLLENMRDLLNELKADHATFRACIDGVLDKLDADAGITDTNYGAIHGAGGSGAALPAALSNSTDITLKRS